MGISVTPKLPSDKPVSKAEKERIRRNRQSILRKTRATRAKDKPAHRRIFSDLLGENVGMGFTPGTSKTRKKGGSVKRKGGGTVKKQVGGLTQGYDARLRESLAARHPAVRGNLAARAAESRGMERSLGRGPYSAARTMVKKGGSVRRKKGSTVSRKGGGKIMQGYKAGGKV
jgi:hypothetical protein